MNPPRGSAGSAGATRRLDRGTSRDLGVGGVEEIIRVVRLRPTLGDRTDRITPQELTDEQIVGKYNVLADSNLETHGVMPLVKGVFDKHVRARFSVPWKAAEAGDADFSGARDLYIDVAMFPILSAEGQLTHVVCQWVDVTEHKRAEVALRESEERLGLVVDATADIVYEWDVASGSLEWFGDLDGVLGYEEGEIERTIEGWVGLIHPEDARRLKDAVETHRTSTEPIFEVYRVRRCDGTWVWWEDRGTPVLDNDAIPIRWVGSCADINERVRAEEAVRESEDRFRTVVANSTPIVFMLDADGRFLLLEGKLLSSLGWKPGEAVGQSALEMLRGTPGALNAVTTALEGRFFEGVVEGGGRLFEVFCSPKKDSQGNVTGAIGMGLDITERRLAEEERLSLERQVQHAQKLESLGVLAGGIAHDFNNILMAVLGYASLAIEDLSETHPAMESVREIEKGAKRAAELTRQMLAYSGKGRFVVEAIDVSALMDDMAHLLRTFVSRTITLNLHLDRTLPTIEADAAEMQQVVMNLITNAAEAIGEQGGAIALSTGAMDCADDYLARNLAAPASPESEVQPGRYVFFEVSDTGCGMNEETKAKLFDPFFTTKFTGRGLGMAAVLGIVRGHRGAIVIDTEVGKGSRFRVLLPAIEGERAPAVEERRDTSQPQGPVEQGTILVVDDEAQVRNLMKLVLERQGFTVLTAGDGRQATEVFREHKDDIVCVLLDLTMPHMSGEETYVELHRIREDTPVILVSGYSEEELKERAENVGFAGFLKKPVGSQALLEKVRAVLDA